MKARGLRVCMAMGLALISCHAQALFYDPFPDADSVKPSDELEERIWDEAEVFRGQFVRGKPDAAVQAMQHIVRGVLARQWPDWSRKVRVYVIDNADVLAVSSANGDIILSTGMLMRLDTEEELQVILARELAHVTQRHAVRSVYAARLGAGANVMFQTVVKANSLVGAVGALGAFQVSPEMLLSDSGKALIQAQLGKVRDSMADNFVRRMSATGFDAMVKTSLFGYSESLESEADDQALHWVEARQGSPAAFRRVMQRLLDEALLDEKKFSAFYANEDRLVLRVKAAQKYEEAFSERQALLRAQRLADGGASTAARKAVDGAPAALVVSASGIPADAVVLEEQGGVVAVVVTDGLDEADGQVDAAAVKTSALSSTATSQNAIKYPVMLGQLAVPVFESELEAGHLGRVLYSLERPREQVVLPEQVKALLAEGCLTQTDPARVARGEELAKSYLADHPQDARILKLLGLTLLKRGHVVQAKDYLERARQFAPTDDERGFIDQYLRQTDKKMGTI
jgi:Zn-dependent protease with chaperone function